MDMDQTRPDGTTTTEGAKPAAAAGSSRRGSRRTGGGAAGGGTGGAAASSRRRGGGATKLADGGGKLAQSTMDSRITRTRNVAVIGAGISGLVCASELTKAGVSVTVIEMGRGPGGRLATRRESGIPFDHGTQYFTCSHPQFEELVIEWVSSGVVTVWDEGNFGSIAADPATGAPCYTPADEDSLRQSEKRYIGAQASNSMCKHLEAGIGKENFLYETVVVKLEQAAGTGRWLLHGKNGAALGEFDVVIASAAVNAHPRFERLYKNQPPLASAMRPDLMQAVQAVEAEPYFSMMLAYPAELALPFDLASFVNSPILARVSRENGKPGRPVIWQDGHTGALTAATAAAGAAAGAASGAGGGGGGGGAAVVERLVLLSTAEYGQAVISKLSINPEELPDVLGTVGAEMLAAWHEVLAAILPGGAAAIPGPLVVAKAHRWNAAFPVKTLTTPTNLHCVVDEEASIIACGDYCVSPNVQGAALSGLSAGAAAIRMCNQSDLEKHRPRRNSAIDMSSAPEADES
eukprot:SAG22_NODE_55_length_23749_cov_24.622918_4_plen_519_part_00